MESTARARPLARPQHARLGGRGAETPAHFLLPKGCILSISTGVIGTLLILILRDPLMAMSIRGLSILLILATLTVYFLLSLQPGGVWSAPVLMFLTLSLFHVGLYLIVAITGDLPGESAVYHSSWFLYPLSHQTALATGIGFFGFLLGSSVTQAMMSRSVARKGGSFTGGPRGQSADPRDTFMANAGAVVVVSAVGFWFFENINANGVQFFTLGYSAYFQTSQTLETGYTILPIMIGLGLVARGARTWTSVLAGFFFVAYAGASFASGARIHALSAITVFVMVVALGRRMPRAWVFWAVTLAALTFISLIRSMRAAGLANLTLESRSINPLEGVAELGATAKVLAMTIQWQTSFQEHRALGASYLNPFKRGLNTITGSPNVATADDPGVMISVIADRQGQIGGSILAEAFYNFGTLGVLLISAAWAAMITHSYIRAQLNMGTGAVVVVTSLFLMQVRGFFGPIPASAIMSVLALAVLSVTYSVLDSRRHKHNGRSRDGFPASRSS